MDQDIINPEPWTYVKIVNRSSDNSELWGRSFPPEPLDKPPFLMGITFVKPGPYYVFERWDVKKYQDGITIQNFGNGLWACAKNGEVVMSNYFDESDCKWHFDGDKGSSFKRIKVPNQDLVWTLKHPKRQFSTVLRPADGSDIQDFCFEVAVED
ncbi:hypothetical protein AGABI1DRAFT_129680 [Agaricus bisporus var. burnettii JB137-S8]|uniref:Uncharacterized protein n=1 Tax=Agaricus bisporus var. burnettii (strain JB137-S8 / ATCC MYA-4627 / FGSC 10392) TaxID=597362 RepID=K5XSG0_AGABU|nr:uncharacterized protein AGABI1DRAFT_129680 [Agaricus bisporus var. burnettii JB137-S8]EKM77885.1 hypothetical protein AGABI1DRAFT_129680 [Agaricus bisporus var. burnettii JB137-S8]